MYKADSKILKGETEVFYSTSTGAGGQRRDRKRTAVRLHHLPSGIRVSIEKSTSQAVNKKMAFLVLLERLKKLNRSEIPRISTRVSRSAKRKRLKEKRIHSEKKQLRRKSIFQI